MIPQTGIEPRIDIQTYIETAVLAVLCRTYGEPVHIVAFSLPSAVLIARSMVRASHWRSEGCRFPIPVRVKKHFSEFAIKLE